MAVTKGMIGGDRRRLRSNDLRFVLCEPRLAGRHEGARLGDAWFLELLARLYDDVAAAVKQFFGDEQHDCGGGAGEARASPGGTSGPDYAGDWTSEPYTYAFGR